MSALFGRVQRADRTTAIVGPRPIGDYTFHEFCALLEIRDKSGGRRSFHPDGWFPAQRRFDAERTGRDVVLKIRQEGMTTLELARDLFYCVERDCIPNVLVIVHDGAIANQLFVTLRIFAACLKSKRLLPRTIYSNARELVFEAGGAVRIVDAGNTTETAEARGRSGTIHRLHCTEQAFWKAAHDTMGSIKGALVADGEEVNESTPNGAQGLYHQEVLAARAGTSGKKFHFHGLLEHPEYRTPVGDGFDPEPRDEHEQALRELGADDEQIQWWRGKVDDPSVGLKKALREWPRDPDSCFAVSDETWVVVPEFKAHHVKRSPLPAYALALTAMDPGVQDKLGIIWGYWDFERAKLVIQGSYAERNVTTTPAAVLIRDTERALWHPESGPALRYWDGRELRTNPYQRVSDVDARMVGDLSREHGLAFVTTAKDDAEAQLYALRNFILADKLEVWPESGPLEEQLFGGRYNKKRTDWERTERLGHLDCVAALIYLVRNLPRTINPNPPSDLPRDAYFDPTDPAWKRAGKRETHEVAAFNQVNGHQRQWGRKGRR